MPRLASPRSVAVALAVVATLALGACGQDEDVTKEQFQADLIERTEDADQGQILTEEAAACLVDAIYDEYDQAEINRIYRAATEDELGNERRDELAAINQRCLGGSESEG